MILITEQTINFDVFILIIQLKARQQHYNNIMGKGSDAQKLYLQKKSNKFMCFIITSKAYTQNGDLQNVHSRAVHTRWCLRAVKNMQKVHTWVRALP